MTLRPRTLTLIIGAATLAAGCVVVPARPARVAVYNPPAPVVETLPAPPAPGYHWVPGHYVWRDGGWFWLRGHYVDVRVPPMPPVPREEVTVAPSPAHVWIHGYWSWGGGRWNWNGGRWVIRGQIG